MCLELLKPYVAHTFYSHVLCQGTGQALPCSLPVDAHWSGPTAHTLHNAAVKYSMDVIVWTQPPLTGVENGAGLGVDFAASHVQCL